MGFVQSWNFCSLDSGNGENSKAKSRKGSFKKMGEFVNKESYLILKPERRSKQQISYSISRKIEKKIESQAQNCCIVTLALAKQENKNFKTPLQWKRKETSGKKLKYETSANPRKKIKSFEAKEKDMSADTHRETCEVTLFLMGRFRFQFLHLHTYNKKCEQPTVCL